MRSAYSPTSVATMFLSLISAFASGYAAEAAKPKEQSKENAYLRVVRDKDDDPIELDTSIVSFVSADGSRPGVVVDLIGAVHIADRSYYSALNKKFEGYDALLYELVAPEGTVIEAGGKREGGDSPVSAIQTMMKDILGLEFQLEQIDYTRKNFVHADMSPEEFAKSMKDRGESFLQIIARMMGQGIALQSKEPGKQDGALLAALLSPNRELQMKRAVADQFAELGGVIRALEGPDGSTLVTERNKKALVVLERELKAGKKRIGIFYGAAHLPDMERRLETDFKLKRDKETWLTAWDMKGKKK